VRVNSSQISRVLLLTSTDTQLVQQCSHDAD